jgi:hypothetical protein
MHCIISPSFLLVPQRQQDFTMKRKDREERISLPVEGKRSNIVETNLGQFLSVLDRPFSKWNEMERVLAAFVPEWTHTERGCLLQHLIHFLELKVVMEEQIPGHLLAPTKLVNKAWQALVLESRLYKKVTGTIQSFHGRKRFQIHYSLMTDMEGAMYESMLRRTQSLFACYYGRQMPNRLHDVKSNFPVMDDASALTDAVAGCGINQRSAESNQRSAESNQRSAGSNDCCVQSPRKKRVHLEASSFGENPFRAKKTSSTVACMKAFQATMFCADEKYVMYGLDKEDYESYEVSAESMDHGTQGVEVTPACP